MARNIPSHDPRKTKIVEVLKKKSGGGRVTLVKEISPGVFQGHCHKYDAGNGLYHSLGYFSTTYEECGFEQGLGLQIVGRYGSGSQNG